MNWIDEPVLACALKLAIAIDKPWITNQGPRTLESARINQLRGHLIKAMHPDLSAAPRFSADDLLKGDTKLPGRALAPGHNPIYLQDANANPRAVLISFGHFLPPLVNDFAATLDEGLILAEPAGPSPFDPGQHSAFIVARSGDEDFSPLDPEAVGGLLHSAFDLARLIVIREALEFTYLACDDDSRRNLQQCYPRAGTGDLPEGMDSRWLPLHAVSVIGTPPHSSGWVDHVGTYLAGLEQLIKAFRNRETVQ